jgi:hypothetical protein
LSIRDGYSTHSSTTSSGCRGYGSDFITRAARIGIETVVTPIDTPQANGVVERPIGTLRPECTDHSIVLSEQHVCLGVL